MRKGIFLSLLVIISLCSTLCYGSFLKFNSTSPIKGKVIDKSTNQPVQNVVMIFTWSEKGGLASGDKIQKTILSGKDGSFSISRRTFWGCPGLGSRIFSLEVSHTNYIAQSLVIATLSFKDHYNWAYMIDLKSKELIIYLTPKEGNN